MSNCTCSPHTGSNCIRETILPTQIKPLRYVRGVAHDGCVAYQEAGALIPDNLVVSDTQTLDLELIVGVLQGNVRISSTAGNIIQILGDGLYVPMPALTGVQDTSTIDHTLAGGILSSTVRISQSCSGNQLVANADGLCVPPPPVVGVTNTPTVTMQLSGGIISSNVRISTQPGNQLTVAGDGLYVAPPPTPPIQTIQDTNTVDLTLTGVTLSAQVRISSTCPNNILTARPDGLCVTAPTVPIQGVQDTNTVDLTLTGTTLRADVIVSPNAGNQLQALPNGLFVPPSPAGQVLNDCNGSRLPDGASVMRCPGSPGQVNINNQTFVGLAGGNTIHGTIPSANCVPTRSTAQIVVADSGGNAFRVPFSQVDTQFVTQVILPNNTAATLGAGNGTSDDVLIDNYFIPPSSPCSDRLWHINAYFNIGASHSNTATPFALSDGQAYIFRVSNSQELARAEAFVFNSANTPGLGNQVILGVGHHWRTETDSAIWYVDIISAGGETIQRRARHGVATGGTIQNRHTTVGINVAVLLFYYY